MKTGSKIVIGLVTISSAVYVGIKMYKSHKENGHVKFWEKENVSNPVEEEFDEEKFENCYRRMSDDVSYLFIRNTYEYVSGLSHEDLWQLYVAKWGSPNSEYTYDELLDSFLLMYNLKLSEREINLKSMRFDDLRYEYEGIFNIDATYLSTEEIIGDILKYEYEII